MDRCPLCPRTRSSYGTRMRSRQNIRRIKTIWRTTQSPLRTPTYWPCAAGRLDTVGPPGLWVVIVGLLGKMTCGNETFPRLTMTAPFGGAAAGIDLPRPSGPRQLNALQQLSRTPRPGASAMPPLPLLMVCLLPRIATRSPTVDRRYVMAAPDGESRPPY